MPWLNPYVNSTRNDRLERNETSVQSAYFFRQFEINPVLEHTSELVYHSAVCNKLENIQI